MDELLASWLLEGREARATKKGVMDLKTLRKRLARKPKPEPEQEEPTLLDKYLSRTQSGFQGQLLDLPGMIDVQVDQDISSAQELIHVKCRGDCLLPPNGIEARFLQPHQVFAGYGQVWEVLRIEVSLDNDAGLIVIKGRSLTMQVLWWRVLKKCVACCVRRFVTH